MDDNKLNEKLEELEGLKKEVQKIAEDVKILKEYDKLIKKIESKRGE